MRVMSLLVRLKLSSCQRRLLLTEGNHVVIESQGQLETSESPREETRLLGSLCIELAKGQKNTWAGLYTSPMGAFLSERTIGR